MGSRLITRRRLLATGALACASILGSRSAWSYAENDRLGVALVGVGGRGRWFVGSIPGIGERVVGLCDVNQERAAEAYRALPDVPRHRDFRRMLDVAGRDIDAVVVAAPDNVHAVVSLAALHAGKHVYCEKPLTHDVREARALAEAARRSGLATQMGNQGTASEGYRRALELVTSGLLGEVTQVIAWKDGGGQGTRPPPSGREPVPDHLDWDLWLGPASERPFHSQWLRWHGWRDFGTGELGNWGCHVLNLPFRALELDRLWRDDVAARTASEAPATVDVRADCDAYQSVNFPRWARIEWRFPARGSLPPARITWHSGLAARKDERAAVERALGRPLDFGDHGRRKWDDHAGVLIVGSRGKMHLNGHNTEFTLLPEGSFAKVERPEPFVLRSPGHEREWARAAKGGEAAMAAFEFAAPLTETVLLGHVATRFAKELRYDPRAGRIVDDPESDRALERVYRDGWSA